MLEIESATGIYVKDVAGKTYLDLNSGICVSSLGHCHPAVVRAIQEQSEKYMHTMVYGEHVQTPQIALATLLADHLPEELQSVYFVNSGTEAVEGALKLAKRVTGRYEVVAARNAYHGSTIGAESLRSDPELTNTFRPSIPGIRHIDYNDFDDLSRIDHHVAAVIVEPVQAEAGVQKPVDGYLHTLRKKCNETGAMLIFDEIQTGFGRTGTLFNFQQSGVVPDIMTIGKAMGGGMPIAAFVSSVDNMNLFTYRPALGHITTFGGHPVTCAASHAALNVLTTTDLIASVGAKSDLFGQLLQHPIIAEVRRAGLMMAVQLTRKRYLKHVVQHTIENGALIDWFLFNQQAFRLAPPLIINEDEIRKACQILLDACEYAYRR